MDESIDALLAAKVACGHVLRLINYYGKSEGHLGIYARELDAALDILIAGQSNYTPIDKDHGIWIRIGVNKL